MEIDLGMTGAAPYEEEIKRCPGWVPRGGALQARHGLHSED